MALPKTNPTPADPSGDYRAMMDYWQTASDLYKGAAAVREGGERYLPRLENESQKQYEDRRKWARYTNIYGDILSTLASKPFTEEVTVGDATPAVQLLIENIDGQGNNLHNFAANYFEAAINWAIDWIYVDYTKTASVVMGANGQLRPKTLGEERDSGERPYWIRVPAEEMIAVYSIVVDGVETFIHCRMRETFTLREGWEEQEVVQIREITREVEYDEEGIIAAVHPAVWKIWRQTAEGGDWQVVESGNVDIGIIPIVPLIIGQRIGNSWRILGELRDCADLQIDLYQQEASLQNARTLTAFPMLSGNGVSPELDPKTKRPIPVPVGPRTVLYAPSEGDGPPGSWSYVEVSATSLQFLSGQIKETTQQLRELGKQPLTAQTGNLTTITTAFAAQKGNSAVQRWALALKDALEQAFVITAMWQNESMEATVSVFTDFEAGLGEDDGFGDLLTMRRDKDLSQATLWEEAKRRGRLGDEFTEERELERLRLEGNGEPEEGDFVEALGNLLPLPPGS